MGHPLNSLPDTDPAFLTTEEQHLASKLQNLGRSKDLFGLIMTLPKTNFLIDSKSLLHILAKKFSLSKGNAHLSSKPVNFTDLSADFHDNDRKRSTIT